MHKVLDNVLIVKQSDQILRKLSHIKNAIQSKQPTSPNNLNDYLPQDRINAKQRINTNYSTQSYRQSLQKKLERLFKQQKMGFNESITVPKNQYLNSNNNFQIRTKIMNKDAFTLQKMQQKIKQLEIKYIESTPINDKKKSISIKERAYKKLDQFDINLNDKQGNIIKNNTSKKNIKSVYQKQQTKNTNKRKSQQNIQNKNEKSDKKLLLQLNSLKKELQIIKKQNIEINQKIITKQQDRKRKKQRSKYLLKCILIKLMEIQDEIFRKDKPQERSKQKNIGMELTPVQERQKLKKQNYELAKEIKNLSKQLKKQINQKQIMEDKMRWLEEENRKERRY